MHLILYFNRFLKILLNFLCQFFSVLRITYIL